MKNLVSLLVFTICFSSVTWAQNAVPVSKSYVLKSCGTDSIHRRLMDTDSVYRQKQERFEEFVKEEKQKVRPRGTGSIYTVPVVVHVMHSGEAIGQGTNITDEEVREGIRQLNYRFRKTANFRGDGDGVDTNVEFALAVRDENGNCTNGIVHYDYSGNADYVNYGVEYSTTDGVTNDELKAASRWDPLEYYNVYVINKVDGENCNVNDGGYTAGYANFAFTHGDLVDGMTILVCSYIDEESVTFTHELGHAFNLYHTFEGDNGGNNCPSAPGDFCDDTPLHIRYQSHPQFFNESDNCGYAGSNTCDAGTTQDHMHNYMDYSWSDCQNEFTNDQKTRINATLSSDRSSFLESNGNVSLIPPQAATIDFSSTSVAVCVGEPVIFYDESICSPNAFSNSGWDNITFSWVFDNGVDPPITSTDQNPTEAFTAAGKYDVSLEITNSNGTASGTKLGYLIVTEMPTLACIPPTGDNEGNFGFVISNVTFNEINNTTSTLTNITYVDFSCIKSTIVTEGETHVFSVDIRAGNTYDQYVEAFIDWNDNGIFENTEQILSGSTVTGTSQTLTANVTIPATAVQEKLLRMRIYANAGGISAAEKSCSSAMFIPDVEDYGVYIEPIPVVVAPVADFSASVTTVCVGTSINFTDVSTNSPTAWSWTFTGANTTTSSVQNPTAIIYNAAGTYQVELTATNTGGSDTETKTSFITVTDVPDNAGAITGNTTVCENETGIVYSITTVNDATSYLWDVPLGTSISSGGGTNSIALDIGTSAGGTLSITPQNNCGDGVSSDITLTVNNCPGVPIADFSVSSTTLCAGSSVDFTDLSSNTPSSWSWTFTGANTTTSSVQSPTGIIYNTAGTYQVELTATNGSGNDTETKATFITVTDVPGDAGAITGDMTVCENATGITYSIAAVNNASSYVWGVPVGISIASGSGTDSITLDIGTSAGGTLNVIPRNSCGDGLSSDITITVNNCPVQPITDFSASSTTVCVGLNVNFTDLSTNTPTSWSWTFTGANTTTSSIQNPTAIVYNIAGTYQVELTATNATGSDTETKTGYILVTDIPADAGNVTGDIAPCQNESGINYSIDAVSGATSYFWDVPNGTNIASGTGTNTITLSTGTSVGGLISVTPNNTCGSSAVETLNLIITDCTPVSNATTPVADFISALTATCSGGKIAFLDNSTNTPTSWSWIFEGGIPSTSDEKNPAIRYNQVGTYDVILTSSNSAGSNTITKAAYISVSNLPGNAGKLTGPNNVCINDTGYVFSIEPVEATISYEWTASEGYRIAEGLGTNSVRLFVETSKAGRISVYPQTACGNGGGASASLVVDDCPITGIEGEGSNSKSMVYPNPTNGWFSVDLRNNPTAEQICLYDVLGDVLFRTKDIDNSIIEINMSDRAEGVYFLHIKSLENVEVIKVIKR